MRKKRNSLVLEHKLFWLGLVAVIVLSLVGMSTGMFTLELATTGKAYQTISHKPAGSELFFEVRNIEGVKDLTIIFLEDAKNMVIEFEEIDALSWKFEGTVYSQFKIFSKDASKIGEMKFTLKLKEAELNKLGLAKDEVRLHLNGQELETKLTKTEGDYVYYETVSNQMGEFVIGKAKPKVEKVVEEPIIEDVEEPVVEEEIFEPEVEEEPIVEEPVPVEKGWLAKIISFFKNLFK